MHGASSVTATGLVDVEPDEGLGVVGRVGCGHAGSAKCGGAKRRRTARGIASWSNAGRRVGAISNRREAIALQRARSDVTRGNAQSSRGGWRGQTDAIRRLRSATAGCFGATSCRGTTRSGAPARGQKFRDTPIDGGVADQPGRACARRVAGAIQRARDACVDGAACRLSAPSW